MKIRLLFLILLIQLNQFLCQDEIEINNLNCLLRGNGVRPLANCIPVNNGNSGGSGANNGNGGVGSENGNGSGANNSGGTGGYVVTVTGNGDSSGNGNGGSSNGGSGGSGGSGSNGGNGNGSGANNSGGYGNGGSSGNGGTGGNGNDGEVPISNLDCLLHGNGISTPNCLPPTPRTCDNYIIITCDIDRLKILSASFGRSDARLCPANFPLLESFQESCEERTLTTSLIEKRCNGRTKCKITMSDGYPDRCACTPFRFLEVEYTCVPYRPIYHPFSNFGHIPPLFSSDEYPKDGYGQNAARY